ncbi:MAG: hypothetical protein JWM57_1302 [Phycisphaerales bacterium]|nr:hypothetical protein [Phycisphaerales bacterium]
MTTVVTAGADRINLRSESWQRSLEGYRFRFSEADANVLYSLSQFFGKCQIHMFYDPAKSGITFKFMSDDKELLTIQGHTKSAFLTEKNVLFFAHFEPSSDGCMVTAHDLATGRKLWETKLSAAGASRHSAYSNEVTMGLSSLTGTEERDEGTVSITGRESYGDYVEILDQHTGIVLAHKVYRQGFGK